MNTKKTLEQLIPTFCRPWLICVTVTHFLCFEVGKLLSRFSPLRYFETQIDAMIPFVAPFILIYVLAFPFWLINVILIARENPSFCKTRIISLFIIEIVSFLFFSFCPTTMNRATVTGTDLFSLAVRFIYWVDTPLDLFPSLHCSITWFCFRGLYGTAVPRSYRLFSCLFALLICASTLFVKQHVFLDFVSGVLLAEVSVAIVPPIERLISQRKNR